MPDNDKVRDRYYQKKYGVGLDWYNAALAAQGGGCAGCGHPAKTILLSIDHDHQWKYVRIMYTRLPDGWLGEAMYWGKKYTAAMVKKHCATKAIRAQLKTASVRGILCFPCNGSVRKLRNNPQIAENLARYLRKHQNGS